MNEVQSHFLDAFRLALSVDGIWKHFVFSDGNTPNTFIEKDILVLWPKEESLSFHLHTHYLNRVLRQDERMFLMFERDVPDRATLYAKDYITIDDEKFEITSARVRDFIWIVIVNILGGI